MSDELEVVPVAWEVRRPGASEDERDLINLRIVDRGVEGHAYAVTRGAHRTLNRQGEWEYESLPSSRDDDYKRRCRWEDFDEAVAAARDAYDGVRELYAHYLDKEQDDRARPENPIHN